RQERHHEDLVVEDPVEHGPQPAEDGVQRRHDGDRQIRLDDRRNLRPDQQAGHDSHDEAQYGDHDVPFSVFSVFGCAVRTVTLGAAGSLSSPSTERAVRMPKFSFRASRYRPSALSWNLRLSPSPSPTASTVYGGTSGLLSTS